MNEDYDIICMTGLQFFGRMSASISHEIKNNLAVLSENAGLLEDLLLMQEKGVPLDPARLKRLSLMLKEHIHRADDNVKKMNRYSHTVDETENRLDLDEVLSFMLELARRLATMRGVTLIQTFAEKPVLVTKNHFLLLNLIWLCLEYAMELTGEKKTIELAVEELPGYIQVRIAGLEKLSDAGGVFPSEQIRALAEVLQASMHVNSGQAILIRFPHDGSRDKM